MSSATGGIKGSGEATLPMAKLTAHATVSDTFEAANRRNNNRPSDPPKSGSGLLVKAADRAAVAGIIEVVKWILSGGWRFAGRPETA